MKRIILIDKNTRVKIISNNFVLQRLSQNKSKKTTTWKYEGYFPTLESLTNYYLNSFPYRTVQGTKDFKELLGVVKLAKKEIYKLIIKLNNHEDKQN